MLCFDRNDLKNSDYLWCPQRQKCISSYTAQRPLEVKFGQLALQPFNLKLELFEITSSIKNHCMYLIVYEELMQRFQPKIKNHMNTSHTSWLSVPILWLSL